MFISSYTLHCYLIFLEKFIFSNVYISVNTTFECLYVFWLRKGHQLSTYATAGNGRVIQMRTATYKGRGCHVSCVRTHYHCLFPYFWQHFCLKVSCFFCRNLTSSLFKKDLLIRNGHFSLTRSVVMKKGFFT